MKASLTDVTSARPSRMPNCLFALLLWLPIVLRPIHTFLDVPGSLNAMVAFVVLGLAIFVGLKTGCAPSGIGSRVLFIGFIAVILLFEISTTGSEGAAENLESFLVVGIPTIAILPFVNDFDEFLKWFASLGLIVGSVYFIDPLNGYKLSGSYMTYGYQVLLPAAASVLVYAHVRGRFWVGVLISLPFASMLAVFGNRFATVSLLILAGAILFAKYGRSRLAVVWGLATGVFLYGAAYLLHLPQTISHQIQALLVPVGVRSYALDATAEMIDGSFESSLSSRMDLWVAATRDAQTSPVVGLGSGHFVDSYGTYPHNLFAEWLIGFGALGLVVLVILLVRSMRAGLFGYFGDGQKWTYLLILSLVFPKLLLSMSFFQDPFFWVLVAWSGTSRHEE